MKFQQILSYFKSRKNNNTNDLRKGRSEIHISSKSTNRNVLTIYNEILEHAYSDSDYWYLTGDGYILDKLYNFNHSDLLELKNDLGNWAFNVLQIFKTALENDYGASHDDLLSTRAYLRLCIITLSNQYINKEKHVIRGLVDFDDELFLGVRVDDKELLEDVKNTLDKVEILFADTKPEDETNYYFIKTRFMLIKDIINSLITVVN